MTLKKGNTYNLRVPVKLNKVNLKETDVSKIVFKFGEIKKEFPGDNVSYDSTNAVFLINFSQEETLTFSDVVEYEVAVKLQNKQVIRSDVKRICSLKTIIEEVI